MNTSNPIKYAVNFGALKSGLSTVGFTLAGFARVTDGILELVPGTGIYGVTIDGITTPGYIIWDTGDTPILYGITDINIPLCDNTHQSVNLDQSRSGLTNVGATIGGVRTIAPELISGSGIYGGLFSPPRGFRGSVFWDSGEGPDTIYSVSPINLEYELLSLFRTSSYIIKKVTDPVAKLELQGATGPFGELEMPTLLVSSDGYLVLSDGSRIPPSPPP